KEIKRLSGVNFVEALVISNHADGFVSGKFLTSPTSSIGHQREYVFSERRYSPLLIHTRCFNRLYMNLFPTAELQFVEMLDTPFRIVRFVYRLGHPVGFVLRWVAAPHPPLVDVEFIRSFLPQAKLLPTRLGFAVSWVKSPSDFECRLSWYLPGESA